jgi:hypothetical protein
VTSLFEKPDVRQLLEQTDSPTVGGALTEPNNFAAGDSRISTRPDSQRTAGASITEIATMTPLRTSDIDVQAMLPTTTPGSLRVRWQHRYGN